MPITRVLLLLSMSIVLAACQATLRADVTTFRTSAMPRAGETISVAATTPSQSESLEFRHHAALLADRLRRRGLEVVPEPDGSMLIAQMEYGIDNGREVVQTRSIPIFGQTGTITSYVMPPPNPQPYGHRHHSGYQSTNYHLVPVLTPVYGITGYRTDVYSTTEYTRILRLTILRPSENRAVYQGSLRSRGACGNLTALIGPMLDVLFKDFPGPDSQNRTVEIDLPTENACRG